MVKHIAELQRKLSLEEVSKANEIFAKLNKVDSSNVIKIISAIDDHASSYINSGESHNARGDPYFVVHAIGGYVNKEGERPDVDLLVATNMRYATGPGRDYGNEEKEIIKNNEYLFSDLEKQLRNEFSVKEIIELPADYNSIHKGLIEFRPKKEGKKIDIVYMKATCGLYITSEEEFNKMDVDEEGKPMPPKIILYRNKGIGARMHW